MIFIQWYVEVFRIYIILYTIKGVFLQEQNLVHDRTLGIIPQKDYEHIIVTQGNILLFILMVIYGNIYALHFYISFIAPKTIDNVKLCSPVWIIANNVTVIYVVTP